MQKFTQKYTIIQLFEDLPVGTQFSSSDWPLHATLVDTFAIDWDVDTMIAKLKEHASKLSSAQTKVMDDTHFGPNGEVQVALLEKTDDLLMLHNELIKLLEQGDLKLNDPQFAKDGFLPHSTVQKHARVNKGNHLTFDSLTLIDMFPDEDPYQRKVLATIKIGK